MALNKSLDGLSQILPSDQILKDSDSLATYGRDWTRYYTPNPSAVLFPKTREDVATIVRWAKTQNVSLVPSGGRTGLSGGAVAKNAEVVVSMERMNKIRGINKVDRIVDVEAGVVTEELQNYASEQGYLFPVDFASRGSSQIGGNIATNAGGINVIRYGMMREWVAGLTVVTGNGDVLELNRGLVKNATGYDLRHLFIGSEGTLGFVTDALIRLTLKPGPSWVLVLGAPDLAAVMRVFETYQSAVPLTAFELFTDQALTHVLVNDGSLQQPFQTRAPYYILIQAELSDRTIEEKCLSLFEKCMEEGWVLDGVVSQGETHSRQMWKLRENISEALSKFTPYKNDISVRVSQCAQFLAEADQLLKKAYPDFEVIWFGHIGDGNLHISILKPASLSMEDFVKRCQTVDRILFETIAKYGGSISAEHGVGLSKKPFLSYTRAPQEIALMKSLKAIFDPANILNPGKIFDLA